MTDVANFGSIIRLSDMECCAFIYKASGDRICQNWKHLEVAKQWNVFQS